MKLTIIPSDGAVYVDGVSFSDIDLSFCPADIHALQWRDDHGHIEFIRNEQMSNDLIAAIPAWAMQAHGLWVASQQNALELAAAAAAAAATVDGGVVSVNPDALA